MMIKNAHTPDVLNCLANLSSDEVFTSPKIANAMLDMLPQELFQNPNITFLDPCTKSGVFLREIAKRLLVGLESIIPDLKDRINHIFKKQLYGIAITELTSLLSRRSLYCSKTANGRYSNVDCFNDDAGNIKFDRINHTFVNHRCKYCGVGDNVEIYTRDDSLENHAYQFIHTEKPEELFNMRFDVIIGNPPYQLNDGGGMGSSAIPLYHKFVQQAKKLSPRYLSMIIPSRWFVGGKGLDDFRDEMLHDNRLRVIYDFVNSNDCFDGVKIEGGICYFLWDRENDGLCEIKTFLNKQQTMVSKRKLLEDGLTTFIRFSEAVEIYKKVKNFNELCFSNIVSTRRPFGFSSTFDGFSSQNNGGIKIYANKKIGYLSKDFVIPQNIDAVDRFKIFISFAYGIGTFPSQIINKPIIANPNSCCTETYLMIGPFDTKEETENCEKYIKTKFFRFMVSLIKSTQNGTRQVYKAVPIQDFSKPWTDKELYAKYNLTDEEINFIENMIKPME